MLQIGKYKFPKGLFYLYLNRTIQLIGLGFLALFLPIYLFEKFNHQYFPVLVFFFCSFLLTFFVIPFGAIIMSRTGLRKSMAIATMFLISYFFCFFLYDYFPLLILLVIAIIVSNVWRMLYWVPFHTEFATFSQKKSRGKQYSILMIISDILGILIPLIAGLILQYYNFPILFIIAIIIIFVSIIPLRKIPHNNERYSYKYLQTYKELFKKKHRKMLLAFMADGAETIIGSIIWPIFIFVILQGEYLAVGVISTLIIGFTVILDLVTGNLSDKFNKKNIIKYSSIFYAIGWLIKIFVSTAFQIFIVSSYHNLTAIFRRIPFDALMYEKAADAGHYVDEFTVLRELSLNLGRILMLILVGVLFLNFGIYIAFILAAFTSLVINIFE